MSHKTAFIACCLITSLCARATSFGAKEEQNINFTGTLKPRDNAPILVERISINGKTELDAYLKPKPEGDATVDEKSSTEPIILKNDPLDFKVGPFKLTNIKNLKIPFPDVDWVYQEPGKKLEKKYTEIIIDDTHYLMPKRTTIRAVNKDTNVDITIAKLSQLGELTITKYSVITQAK